MIYNPRGRYTDQVPPHSTFSRIISKAVGTTIQSESIRKAIENPKEATKLSELCFYMGVGPVLLMN